MVDFIKPMSKKDAAACISLIKELKSQFATDLGAWEESLVSITKAIEQHYDPPTLQIILKELPSDIKDALYCKIASSTGLVNISCKTLVEHINSLSTDENAQVIKLSQYLLYSPIPIAEHSDVQELILKLKPKEQGLLLTQLREQATQHQPSRETTPSHVNKMAELYHNNYQQLLVFLTMQASKTEIELEQALNDDTVLANHLIGKLLETNLDDKKAKETLNLPAATTPKTTIGMTHRCNKAYTIILLNSAQN